MVSACQGAALSLPLPACGERVGEGHLEATDDRESPSPGAQGRADLSPQAGRAKERNYCTNLGSASFDMSGIALMMPISSSRSAASFENAACSPAKNFWFAALSCQRRYLADLPHASPDCFTSAPMI